MTNDDFDAEGVYDGAERELVRRALAASGMSARSAAGRMNMSDARLRQIINGYQPAGRGQRVSVVAPAATLARIADVLEIDADDLAAAGREDAARELRDRRNELGSMLGDPREDAEVVREVALWAEDPVRRDPPPDSLRFFEDAALLDELRRRLTILRAGQFRPPYSEERYEDGVLDARTRAELEERRRRLAQEAVERQKSVPEQAPEKPNEKRGTAG